jgi:hypothetical protein
VPTDQRRKPLKITPEIQSTICAFIMAGGFPHVAAQAAGVPQEKFQEWWHKGSLPKANALFRHFYLAVEQAKAQARLNAEMKVMEGNPLAWLKSGPGKENSNSPGWTGVIKPQITQDNRQINVLLSPEMQGVFAAVLQVLAPFPEARAAVASALAGGNAPTTGTPHIPLENG